MSCLDFYMVAPHCGTSMAERSVQFFPLLFSSNLKYKLCIQSFNFLPGQIPAIFPLGFLLNKVVKRGSSQSSMIHKSNQPQLHRRKWCFSLSEQILEEN